jgi:glycosyltransferase involved in cell wall biosynthesis
MRIWLVNRFYWPDEPATAQLLGDLAEGLAARGHEVHVLTSRSTRTGGGGSGSRNGVSVHRIHTRLFPGDHLPARAVAFIVFLVAALWLLCRRLRPEDRLVALTDPPLLGFVCRLAAGARRALLFQWVQDIHPEVAIRVLDAPPFDLPLKALLPLRNHSWRASACCVAPSAGMAARISRITPSYRPALLLHNWAPAGLRPAPVDAVRLWRETHGLQDRFVLMYSGNLGRVHDMTPIATLLWHLNDCPSVHLVVVGRGAGLSTLREECQRKGVLGKVSFLPPCPRAELALSLSSADLHLVTLAAGCENLVFPSKLYGIAAVGRPVLAIAPEASDLVRLVRENGLGLSGPASSTASLALGVKALLESPARQAAHGAAALRFLQGTGDAQRAVLFWESLLASPRESAPCSPP